MKSVSFPRTIASVPRFGNLQPHQAPVPVRTTRRAQLEGRSFRWGSAISRRALAQEDGQRSSQQLASRGSAVSRAPSSSSSSPTTSQQPCARHPPVGRVPVEGGRSVALRVAVDVDEVLARFLLALNSFCAEEHDMHYEVSDYDVYDFKTVWDCSQEASNDMVHAFFESHHFRHGVPAIEGAEESLRRLASFCELVVVTSRQHVIQEPTMDWLDDNFPDIFEEVHFGNHFALEGKSRKKSEICREIGAEVLIDDNPGYAMDCAEAGIHVLLFDWNLGYPWAKTENNGPHHPNITRVSDWAAVETMLRVLAMAEQPR
mmetsp:Transcript_17813/g.34454  ORF Transcript_17813/g.34454 Transcript_17813/m.34454 type:complete len:316 (-) Transcript_17813:88-1035(-)